MNINRESEEARKIEERRHANKLKEALENAPDREKVFSNKKFYSVVRGSRNHIENFLKGRIGKGRRFLDYCCGDGVISVWLANAGADVFGIDISDVSIRIAQDNAKRECRGRKPRFWVMDAEKTAFDDNTFDTIYCGGVLHHLDIDAAYKELARILKPGGKIICGEPLAYNPIFQLYRQLTPKLRTEWEAKHILTKKSIFSSRKYFGKIEIRFFHLTTLIAVPFRHAPVFLPVLSLAEVLDLVLLRIPLVKWLAWQTVFVLSEPKK